MLKIILFIPYAIFWIICWGPVKLVMSIHYAIQGAKDERDFVKGGGMPKKQRKALIKEEARKAAEIRKARGENW